MADDLTPYSRALAPPEPKPTAEKPKSRRRSPAAVAAFLKEARERFKTGQDAEAPQRRRELEDLRFYAGEQWPQDVLAARAGQQANNGLPPIPARPCLTINKTREPVRQVLNQERNSEMGLEIVPADDFGELIGEIDDTEIQLREGLVRRIQRESEAADARTWAFARATIAGRGYYGVLTRYVPGKTRDQEIYVHRFWNQACVTIDPTHEQPDGSDADWGFIGTDMPWEQYKAEFPDSEEKPNRVTAADNQEFRALGDEAPDWFQAEGETRTVRVVDYWYTERDTRKLCMLEDGRDLWQDELSEADRALPYETREVVEKHIRWAKIDGVQILDETDWPGHYIPIVKILGEELQPYDKERRVEGMVRPMREPGYGFNVMVSSWVERIGLAPLPPLMIAEGQTEGYEAWYQAANTRALPYLPYKQKDLEGNSVAQPPFVPQRDLASIIAPLAQSVQMFDQALQSTSAVTNPALGQSDPSVKSAKHAKLLQLQSEQGTSNFMDNLKRSIRHEGRIINDLLYPIYGIRPGRIARILNPEGEPETVMLHKPFTKGENGRPRPVEEGQPGAQTYRLTKDAQFNVVVKVSRAFDTRRQEEATILGELLSAAPQLMAIFGDLFFKNQDGPGHEEMAERAKAVLAPPVQAMLAQKQQGQEPNPLVQQLQGQVQQLQGQLQQAVQQIQNDSAKESVKAEAQFKIESMKLDKQAQLQIELQRMKDAATIRAAEIAATKQVVADAREDQTEAIALQMEQAHEAAQADLDRAHEAAMAQMGHEQALEQADQGVVGQMAVQAAQPQEQPEAGA